MSTPDFSIIVTCYFEERSIDEFHARLSTAAQSTGCSYEIVMVNDGSTDETWQKLLALFERDPHVATIVNLYRNAGQAAAMTAGINHARGNALVFIDSDLQLDPEELPLLVTAFQQGYDIVSGARKERHDSLWRRFTSSLANRVMRRVAQHRLTDFGCTFKIYDAKLVRAFELGPFKPFRTAYVFARAQRCCEVPVSHHPRRYGRSGWSPSALFGFWMDHVVGLSERPFQLLSILCLVAASLLGLRLLLAWLVPFSILPEVTPGMLLNVLALNLLILLSVLSALGEYVIRNFTMLQRHPAYIERDVISRSEASSGERLSVDPAPQV